MADMTSAERDFPGVEELREMELRDLDQALYLALRRTVTFVKEKGGALDPMTVAACDELAAQLSARSGS